MRGIAYDPGERGAAAFFGLRASHQDQRRGAVRDRARVCGGDGAVFPERGLELRDLVEVGLERLLVVLDARFDLALDHDRHDLAGEMAALDRFLRPLERSDGIAVLRLARKAV